jgi:anaphase-promoting complex subunit 6
LLSAKRIQKLYEYIKQPFNANQLSETDTNDIKTEIEIILLAAQCLFSIQEYDDCINLLYPIISLDEVFEMSKISLVQQFKFVHKIFRKTKQDVDDMAGIFCIAGKCFDALENRSKSIKFLSIALGIDIACIEAAEYMIEHGMLLTKEKQIIFQNLHSNCSESKEWLLPFYRTMFLNENPLMLVFQLNENQIMSNNNDKDDRNSDLLQQYTVDSKCASWLVQLSEYYFDHQQIDESYLFARKAYTIDPYNNRGLLSYIAGLVELNLKTELFYLGHELVYSTPKSAISWYAVGCYYWCCCKFETAQKYFQKTLKLDKKLANAYIMLGHVLCAQEESEQAISAYRTATRLLPTDHRPIVYMAKEMIRTNYSTLAQQLLIGALNICSTDATLFNEIAVIYQKHGRLDMAKQYLEYAISTYYKSTQQNQHNFKNSSKTKLTFLDFSIKGALQDNKFPYRRNCTVEVAYFF